MAMQAIKRSKFNCHQFSRIGGNDVLDWTESGNTSEVIDVWLYPNIVLQYTDLNETHYQWCGPLLLLVEYFGKFMSTRIRFSPSIQIEEMLQKNEDEFPHFIVGTLTSNQYCSMNNLVSLLNLKVEDVVGVTSSVTNLYVDNVIASTVKGNQNMFNVLASFDYSNYIAIILSMIIMSLVVAISRKSMQTFFEYFWSYLSVILSDYYSLKIKSRIDKLFTGVWLMSCTVLLAAFSGLLRDRLLEPQPIYWIDSWKDLAQREHLKIHTFDTSGISIYTSTFPTETLTQNLAKRIKRIKIDEFEVGNKSFDYDLDYRGIVNGEVAFSENDDYLNILKQNLITRYGLIEDIDFHISRTDEISSQPIFWVTNKLRFNNIMANKLNLV